MRTNVVKMVIMACQPCCAIVGHSAEAYSLRMMGEGITYHDILHQQFLYPECDMDVVAGSLDTHWRVQHGLGQGNLRATPPPPGTPQIYPGHIRSTNLGHHVTLHARWKVVRKMQ